MNTANVTLRRADEETLGYVEDLLMRNDLPAEDVRENPGAFYVARAGDDRVGVGGIEQYGSDGLLRSVVVEESARGEGVGTELCATLEAVAREAGVERLYLLTTTAAGFFAGRGYAEIERDAAPDPIRDTTEFAELCPASATCLRKSL
jgi:amino-acid N-acetyltransferase